MNLSNGKGSMTTSTSWKSNDVVSDQFPAGLRVLVVDDDPTCLMILEKMLRTCLYDVTKCNRAEHALSLLRENKNGFDIVISDVHMPDMDGFKLLEHIGLEMDLPVIMMSADDGKNVVMKGVTHGACDYLIKPVRIEALKNIWQHVVRKKKNEWRELEHSGSVEEGDRSAKPSAEDADYSSSANEGNWKSSKKRKDDEDEGDERDDSSTLKKPRVVWSVELHQQFVAAVNQLGIDKAVPKKILELMNVPGLTRENVASHLQKYRLYLRRLSGQHQTGMNNSFMSPQEATFGPMTSLNGIDLQTLAQIPVQSLATLQADGLGRPSVAKSGLPLPLVDHRNLFSFENPKMRFGDAQQLPPQTQPQQPSHLGNAKPVNLLHGIPTSMEPKQLTNLHQSAAQSLGMNMPQISVAHGAQNNPLLVQMSQPRAQILSETAGAHVSRLYSPSIKQPNIGSRNGIGDNGRGSGYSPVLQNPSMLNFPINQTTTVDLPGNSFPLSSTPSISSNSSKAPFSEINSDIKGSTSFVPSYDIFNDLSQHNKPNDWDISNVGLPFDASQQPNAIQSGTLYLVHQGFSSGPRNMPVRSQSSVGKAMYSLGDADLRSATQNIGQQNLNTLLESGSVRVKTERVPDMLNETGFYTDQYGQEDLMSALLKQQEGIAPPAENQFDFDGYSTDNIPV